MRSPALGGETYARELRARPRPFASTRTQAGRSIRGARLGPFASTRTLYRLEASEPPETARTYVTETNVTVVRVWVLGLGQIWCSGASPQG
eukprot:8002731-Pyramimonas_sp.AAC.1